MSYDICRSLKAVPAGHCGRTVGRAVLAAMSGSRSSILPKRALHLKLCPSSLAPRARACRPSTPRGRAGVEQPGPPDLDAFAKAREVIRREYAEPVYFQLHRAGSRRRHLDAREGIGRADADVRGASGSAQAWRRLIAVDGKPLDRAELARRDDEHRRKRERDWAESPRQRTARLQREAEELRERDDILDDAERVLRSVSSGAKPSTVSRPSSSP